MTASIHDVARAAGVSTATVSRALRGLPNVSARTREAERSAAQDLEYVVSLSASNLASGRTRAMGVIVPSVSQWFYTSVVEGIDAELRATGYDMVLFNLGGRDGDRERVLHRSILRKKTDALIALCMDFSSDERYQLASTGLPTLVVGGVVRGLRHVGVDEVSVARAATQYLIDLGHRQIAYIGGENDDRLNPRVHLNRHKGYQQALMAAGLEVNPRWSLEGKFKLEASRQAMLSLLQSGVTLPTAVFAASDEMAVGAMLALAAHGLSVPGDVSIIGIDNHELAVSFGLTTMAQDPYAQGALAARMLLDELGGKPPRVTSVRSPFHLIERTSTGPVSG
jgi:LacI family transcriptional regulator, repressor for deo operon, udp, cdd, tsx, nupC, and nupG